MLPVKTVMDAAATGIQVCQHLRCIQELAPACGHNDCSKLDPDGGPDARRRLFMLTAFLSDRLAELLRVAKCLWALCGACNVCSLRMTVAAAVFLLRRRGPYLIGV